MGDLVNKVFACLAVESEDIDIAAGPMARNMTESGRCGSYGVLVLGPEWRLSATQCP